jgi:cbb3-type cytochrome oxidase cytochrome c subunit
VGEFIGPDLTHIGSIQTADYLRQSILDPNAVIVPGYQPDIMMGVFKQILTDREVNDIVAYMQSLQ